MWLQVTQCLTCVCSSLMSRPLLLGSRINPHHDPMCGGNGRGGGGNGRINLIGYGTGIGESFVICAFLPYKIPTDGSLTVCSGGGGGGGGGC